MKKPISSNLYTKKYFLTTCAGFNVFKKNRGIEVDDKLKTAINLAEIKKGNNVLDIGCGRGELLIQLAKDNCFAYGIDYSDAAVKIAKGITKNYKNIKIKKADIKKLPFKSGMFNYIFLIDVVEHLHQWELNKGLREIKRVLTNNGEVIIHTDNKLYKSFIGNLIKGLTILLRKYKRNKYEEVMHVNYKTLNSLKNELKKEGFYAEGFYTKFDEKNIDLYLPFRNNNLKRLIIKLIKIIEKTPLYSLICPTIWVKGEKN